MADNKENKEEKNLIDIKLDPRSRVGVAVLGRGRLRDLVLKAELTNYYAEQAAENEIYQERGLGGFAIEGDGLLAGRALQKVMDAYYKYQRRASKYQSDERD